MGNVSNLHHGAKAIERGTIRLAGLQFTKLAISGTNR